VDPDIHFPARPIDAFRGDLSYLGTYAADRQEMLERLLIEPARALPDKRFVIAGAQYPAAFPWTANIYFVRHLPPGDHSAFYASSRLTLNITRQAMRRMGWCPSGRLFEAAAARTAILSDWWEGLDEFFTPGEEVLIARDAREAVEALQLSDAELERIREAARARALEDHTASRRAAGLERILETANSGGLTCGV
jgi:spore maturation protein CgeB